ncbi:MAG: hypothetical protein ACRD2C_14135 [Acidimicrobiales bacterium]
MSRLVSLVSRSECPPRPADELFAEWYKACGTSLPFAEWCDPTVRGLAATLGEMRGPRMVDAAVVAFAQARAGADHPAEEVAADLTALVRLVSARSADRASAPGEVTDHPSPDQVLDPVALVARALAAWAAEQVAVVSTASCTDPVTGLVNGGFLRARLRELHAQCDALTIAPPVAFASLVVRLDLHGVPVPDQMSARIATGRALRLVFRAGETVAALSPTRLVAVMPAYALDRARGDLQVALAQRPELEGVAATIDGRAFGDDADDTWRSLAGIPVGA